MSRKETHPWRMRRNKFCVLNEPEPVYNHSGFEWGGNQAFGTGTEIGSVGLQEKRPWYRARIDDGLTFNIYGQVNYSGLEKNTYTRYPWGLYKHSYDGSWQDKWNPLDVGEHNNACRVTRPSWTESSYNKRGVSDAYSNATQFTSPAFQDAAGTQYCFDYTYSFWATKTVSRTSPNLQHNPQKGVVVRILCTVVTESWIRNFRIEEVIDETSGGLFGTKSNKVMWYPSFDWLNSIDPYDRWRVAPQRFLLESSRTDNYTFDVVFDENDNPAPLNTKTTNFNLLTLKTKQWTAVGQWAFGYLNGYEQPIEITSPSDKVITRTPSFMIVSVDTGSNY